MSWQIQTFLWLFFFCAICQIGHLKIMIVGYNVSINSSVTGCPAINQTCRKHNNTLTEKFCIMEVKQNTSSRGNCTTESGEVFYFNITNNRSEYKVMMNETVRNITILFLPDKLQYLTLDICDNSSFSSKRSLICPCALKRLLNVNTSPVDPEKMCNTTTYSSSACDGVTGSKYILYVNMTQKMCVTCITPSTTTSPSTNTSPSTTTSKPSEMVDNLQNIADEMEKTNETTKEIKEDGIKGLIYRLDKKTEAKSITMFCSSNQDMMKVSESQNISEKEYYWYVKISEEAFNKSRLENNGSAFVGVLQFNNMNVTNEDKNPFVILNNEVYGISMGANISNLTDNIDIIIAAETLVGNPSCMSWDGKGEPKWTAFGCDTVQINTTRIKCSCSHLTFFAVLMSIPSVNITAHVESLTYISYIGCGFSMFFLGIALFMHFLLRRNRSNQATKILINMLVALFILNLSFLSNESIANTQDHSTCVFIALIMHYSMLSTFTWFFLQALHMYLWLIRQNITMKNYMKKMTVTGWVCPSPIVLIVASLGEYKSVIIKATSEKTTRMCWITNHYIHYIVNIGYYSLVFIFTAGVFIMIVTKISQMRNLKVGEVKKQLMMVLSLFILLGLTWAVAFFSYGDMVIPSYYIFCLFNSFQGFFLFLYYYHIHNDVGGHFSDDPDRSLSSSTITQSTITTTQENIYT